MGSVMLSYLAGLEQNNNRDYFHAHKAEYQAAAREFEDLIQALIFELGKTDGALLTLNPRELTFKLMRDTRFSHDKSPYNPAFRCHIAPAGKLPVPVGYFLCLRPGNKSFLGGGLFADMFKDATRRIRDYLCAHGEEFLSIIGEPAFARRFQVEGAALKNVPKEYPADSPMAEYLKYKSLYIEYPVADSLLDDTEAFVTYAVEAFLQMKPFNDYLNRALEGFQMPSR